MTAPAGQDPGRPPPMGYTRKPNRRHAWSDESSTAPNGHRWRLLGLVVGVVLIIMGSAFWIWHRDAPEPEIPPPSESPLTAAAEIRWWQQTESEITASQGALRVTSSLSAPVQTLLRRKTGPLAGRAVGVVLVDARSGQIRAMYGFNPPEVEGNPCSEHPYPVAGLFQVVTTAAVVTSGQAVADTTFTYAGSPKRLNPDEVTTPPAPGQGTIVTLGQALGGSIYPVFGRLGANPAVIAAIHRTATALGFAAPLRSGQAIRTAQSRLATDRTNRDRIRLAAGFTLDTVMTPLHAAMIGAAMINGGRLLRPTVVEAVADAAGHRLFSRTPDPGIPVVPAPTADAVAGMMVQALAGGTTSPRFHALFEESDLGVDRLGGVSAVVSDDNGEFHYDWFMGFGRCGGETIAVAALVVHYRIAGVRADYVAGLTLKRYFTWRRHMISKADR